MLPAGRTMTPIAICFRSRPLSSEEICHSSAGRLLTGASLRCERTIAYNVPCVHEAPEPTEGRRRRFHALPDLHLSWPAWQAARSAALREMSLLDDAQYTRLALHYGVGNLFTNVRSALATRYSTNLRSPTERARQRLASSSSMPASRASAAAKVRRVISS